MQELTLKEIYNTLVPKLKMFLVILLIGAVVGGCVGVARTYASIAYGTTIEFYVNPKRSDEGGMNESQFGVYGAYGWHVMDNMTKLLASESFAEEMLLDEDGLPIKVVLKSIADRSEIDPKIDEARAAIAAAKSAEAPDSAVSEDELAELKDDAQKKISAVIELWRQTDAYYKFVATITSSVKYSFYNDGDMQTGNSDSLAKSFIYVKISAYYSEDTAKFIYDRINEVLPEFVEKNMAVPSGYIGTNCQRITRLDEIRRIGGDNLVEEAVKYAALLGFLAMILSMIFVVIADRCKKWSALNKSAESAALNTSDVALGDGAVRTGGDSKDKDESSPDWQ